MYKNFLIENDILNETKKKISDILKSTKDILDNLNMNNEYLYNYTKLILNRDA